MTSIVGVVASPTSGGRTTTAVRAVLAGTAGAEVELVELAQVDTAHALDAMESADAVVFGSPVYRAGHSAALRALLEQTQRGRYGETTAPLRGKATAIVMTGASHHHFLAPDGLRSVLASFFAAQVLSPALYFETGAFTPDKTLTDEAMALAAQHGAALLDLTRAVRSSTALQGLDAQV